MHVTIITVETQLPGWRFVPFGESIVCGYGWASTKIGGFAGRTESDVEKSVEKARQSAIEQMRYRAERFSEANVVHSVRFQFVPIDAERLMVTAIGQATFGEQVQQS